jgi:hypothetical protein
MQSCWYGLSLWMLLQCIVVELFRIRVSQRTRQEDTGNDRILKVWI